MTIESWGIGKPDFVTLTVPSRTEVQADSQEAWALIFEAILPPDYAIEATLYVVPANRKLVIGHSKSSARIDGIGYAHWIINGVSRSPVWTGSEPIVESFSDISGIEYDAGTTLGLYMLNTLNCAQPVAGGFSGFLYKV